MSCDITESDFLLYIAYQKTVFLLTSLQVELIVLYYQNQYRVVHHKVNY